MQPRLKTVYFGAGDQELYDLAGTLKFSDWVKRRLREELETRRTGINPALVRLVEGLVETRLAGRVTVAEKGKDATEGVQDVLESML